MLVEQFTDDTIQQRLNNFPNLKKYTEFFNQNDGISEREDEFRLPNLVIWFRRTLAKANIEYPEEFFDWNEDEAEDFYSWGSNSRWNRTFRNCLKNDFEYYISKALDLAEKYGDINVEQTN